MTASPETVTPAMRFPEFRDADGWNLIPLSSILEYEQPTKYIATEFTSSKSGKSVPVLTANKSFILGYTKDTKGVYTRVPVIIFDDFTTDKKFVDFPFKVRSSALKILKSVSSENQIRLIYEQLRSIDFDATEHKRYYISEYQHVIISLPTVPEQQRIADCLSSIDELIAIAEQELQTLRDHKQGLMQQLFPAAGKTHPALRFPEFRDAPGWEEKSLNEICDGIHQGGTPDTSNSDYWDGDLPWLTPAEMGNLKSRFVNSTKRNLSLEGLRNCSSKLLPINSIILSTRAPIGYLAINLVEMAFNQGCRALVPSKQLLTDFLYYYLTTKETELNNLGAGSTFKELTGSILRNLKLAIPNTAEQQKIADCLSSVDSLIANAEERLATLRNHKQGLMQQLFPSTKATMHG